MSSFFEKKDKLSPSLEGEETTITSHEELEVQSDTSNVEVTTTLSFHPDWTISDEERDVFESLNKQCSPMKPNELSLSGITMAPNETDGLDVVVFIRNSYDKPMALTTATLILMDAADKAIARRQFQLSMIGDIPAHSSRPWRFTFTSKDILQRNVPDKGWKLAFRFPDTEAKHRLELGNTWKKALSKDAQKQLRQIVEKMDPPKKGEVNFFNFQAKLNPMDGALHVSLLIRNGTDNILQLSQLPLQVEDAKGEMIARANFTLQDFSVSANATKPWTFIFPKKMLQKEKPDLSRWRAYTPNKSKN